MAGQRRGRRAFITAALIALTCAVPAAVASPSGKLTGAELEAKARALLTLHESIDRVLKYEPELANLCEGAKQHPGANLKRGLKRVTENLQETLVKHKNDAKLLEKWADGLDARANGYGSETVKQLVKEASASLLVGISAYEDAIDELKAIAGQEGKLSCQHSYLQPLNHLNDGWKTSTQGIAKLQKALRDGF